MELVYETDGIQSFGIINVTEFSQVLWIYDLLVINYDCNIRKF